MSKTRTLAKEAAFKLLQSGQRPTAERVRAAIGQGAQQTILGALDEFWQEIGERLREPRLPDPLVEPVMTLWSQAVGTAASQWQTERKELEARIGALESREQTLTLELNEVTEARGRAETAAATAETLNAELQQELNEQRAERQTLQGEADRLSREATQTGELLKNERDARDRDQAAWLQQIDAARQATKTALAERDRLAKELNEAREARTRQEVLLAQADDRRKELTATLASRTQAFSAAQARAAAAERQAEDLDSQLERTSAIAEALKAQLRSGDETSKEMTERFDSLKLERERLVAENRTLRDELSVLRARREEFEISVQRALGQLERRVGPHAETEDDPAASPTLDRIPKT
ncbi:DNA-binding protein [Thiorhodococcus minor]|uniref:KfrA N-terminal DNA-binding domain-containing protein n=1 Tax=Thiorhodococcus minor TaxID=57489 RepID=A0A6M0K4M3_9GAMM|nr:DNA-binding protein [Thiorhodococcus minor]NEV64680.1 hypothetical protein [Thiorhodococcus minor]